MKKIVICSLVLMTAFTSCSTIFTSSKQNITFVGEEGTRIYDNGMKIATIGENGETSVRIRKKLASKELVAKKDGYKSTPLLLQAAFNPISCINLLNVLAWGIDLATQKVCKWENTHIEVELEKEK